MSALLNTHEAAARLRLGERTIRTLVYSQAIPYYRIQSAIRFDPDELDAWLKKRHVGAREMKS
jgi:excisionase family DNA binding protein